MRYLPVLFILLAFAATVTVHAKIFAEDVGGTQYGTGHLAAAQKYRERIDTIAAREKWSPVVRDRIYLAIEQMLCVPKENMSAILQRNFPAPHDRRVLLKTIVELQDTDQKKVVQLLMIGNHRAVAVDGHHRIRTRVQLSNILKVSNDIWSSEVKSAMTSLDRVKKNGEIRWSLPIENPQIIGELPKDAKAKDVMETLLKQGMGLWKDPDDMALAKSFFGKKAKDASKKDLLYLAEKLGIVDSPAGVKYVPVVDLPDASMRTVMGNYFRSRGMKSKKISFQAYVEFYLGDEVRSKAFNNRTKYPNLNRILVSDPSIINQKLVMQQALEEIDQIFVDYEDMTAKATGLTISGTDRVEETLNKIRFFKCGKGSAMELSE